MTTRPPPMAVNTRRKSRRGELETVAAALFELVTLDLERHRSRSGAARHADALRRLFDRADDARVRAAAADVAIHHALDVLVGRVGVVPQQADRRHHHARRAVAALERLGFEESFLHRMQALALGNRLNGCDPLARNGAQACYAGPRRLIVDEDGAGAAIALTASVFRSCQAELVTQARTADCRPAHLQPHAPAR